MQIVDPRTGAPMENPAETSGHRAGAQDVDDASIIVTVDMSNFQQVVLEGSMNTPVLLECLSSGNDECQRLTPVLEKLAREYKGAFILAKLDIDSEPQIAAQLGVRAAPDVKLIAQGQLYDQFQGALPEQKIREWLGQYLEAPQDTGLSTQAQAEQAVEQGDTATAKTLYQQLINESPNHHEYKIDYAGVLTAEGDFAQALEILDALPPEDRDSSKGRGVRARIEFAKEAPSREDVDALGARDDSEAQFLQAQFALGQGQYEPALEALLTLMQKDRSYGDDIARKTLLRVFDALGKEHALTTTYRRRMFTLLY
ncbi:tetratricopeptide repeat protein [Larsenimonas suaedae]|uniref:Tetratricopeptide repeat protein n=1 Tax=Larsenimonas suaedae TaxID=1851019 RepID=A0ABU1GX82_9GAMM|nr:tetratricopeptide repeat protein [Larsenimonas suaedae]MCM2973167.1 tetratricopeptide repeat protein [Larsenimonas suaedae]MDR5896604.1 tetratricopeptide repeat protein [Larsenimonas suaedae]